MMLNYKIYPPQSNFCHLGKLVSVADSILNPNLNQFVHDQKHSKEFSKEFVTKFLIDCLLREQKEELFGNS